MPIRPATYKDISAITNIFALTFYDEGFHAAFFPHRHDFPEDYLRAWRHRSNQEWWNYRKHFVVSYKIVNGEEVLVGAAEWTRCGDGWERFWGVWGPFDPRLVIHPLLKSLHTLHRLIFPNRAALNPTGPYPNNFTFWTWETQAHPYTAAHFHPPNSPTPPPIPDPHLSTRLPPPPPPPPSKSPYLELTYLCVLPGEQTQGVGRELVRNGLGRARDEDIPCVVVAALGKDRFYRRCGFSCFRGWATEGVGNPLRILGIRGGAVLWTHDWAAWGEKSGV